MDSQPTARLADSGLATAELVLASALGLLLFVGLANLVVVQYGRGAIRSGVEQGVRAATTSGSLACEVVAREVVQGLLGGAMSDDLSITCSGDGSTFTATAEARFPSWTPLTADFEVVESAVAVAEP